MRDNPGAQKAAFEVVIKVSEAIDAKFSVEMTQDFEKHVAAGAFK